MPSKAIRLDLNRSSTVRENAGFGAADEWTSEVQYMLDKRFSVFNLGR
jgi:hypothetical protein